MGQAQAIFAGCNVPPMSPTSPVSNPKPGLGGLGEGIGDRSQQVVTRLVLVPFTRTETIWGEIRNSVWTGSLR